MIPVCWSPLASETGTTASSATSIMNAVSLPASANTHQQRFNLATSRCTVIASILADLPASEFPTALQWLDGVEQKAKERKWTHDDTVNTPAHPTNDHGADLDIPHTVSGPSSQDTSLPAPTPAQGETGNISGVSYKVINLTVNNMNVRVILTFYSVLMTVPC